MFRRRRVDWPAFQHGDYAMVENQTNSPVQHSKRRSRIGVIALLAVVVTSVGAFAGWRVMTARNAARHTGQILTAEVKRDAFSHEVVERGTIDSSHNVEVRCEVRSRSQNGTPILEIVEEGTHVKEGDFLVRLDDSLLQADLVQQQIVVQNSDAAMIQAETVVETSILARQEYENGTYKQEVEEVQSLVFVAEENLRRAEEYYRYSLRLASKGYVTNIQLEAYMFAVYKAMKERAVPNTTRVVLINFTK
jgi:multidrug efflux pump subunit AcrA (membrane-fusion protein)